MERYVSPPHPGVPLEVGQGGSTGPEFLQAPKLLDWGCGAGKPIIYPPEVIPEDFPAG